MYASFEMSIYSEWLERCLRALFVLPQVIEVLVYTIYSDYEGFQMIFLFTKICLT